MPEVKFEERQQFNNGAMYAIYAILLAVLALFLYADIKQLGMGTPFGDKPAPDFVLILVTVLIAVTIWLFYRASLETRITGEEVSFRWAPFQRSYKKFTWDEINRAEMISHGAIGYGVRISPYGMVHTVGGNMGLRIELRSGKSVVLGTQKPDELEEFLKRIRG